VVKHNCSRKVPYRVQVTNTKLNEFIKEQDGLSYMLIRRKNIKQRGKENE
jgi:hypothetical protein